MKKNKKIIPRLVGLVIASSVLFVNVAFAEEVATSTPVSIHVDIESATSTLFSADIDVTACSTSASSTPTVNGYCAVNQSGLESVWSAFGDDRFLDSVAGVGNDYANNAYWGWFSDLEYGQTALNQHIVTSGENLLVTIGRMPLKLVVSSTTPYVGGTTTASVFRFGFDDSWNGVWFPAASSSIEIGTGSYPTDAQGRYDISIGSTTPFTIFAREDGFLESGRIVITPTNPTLATTTDTNSSETGSSGGTGGSGDGVTADRKGFDTPMALRFLLSKQKSDGSFGSSLYTDWVAIALAAAGENTGRDKLISYLKTTSDSLTRVTDYERHAMALMAMGINPYSGTTINYIQNIVDQFDGTQIGNASLVNDDVFALFPLIRAGYSESDPIIQKTISFIISRQNPDGSWEGSVDMTAAAIQALNLAQSLDGVSQALTNARSYLSLRQQSDGGFGSSFATSWALQAMASLGESSENSLASLQQNDGGVEVNTTDENTRVWATAYAIPAILHKSWFTILSSFSKPVSPVINTDDVNAATTTELVASATSTLPTATTSIIALQQFTVPRLIPVVSAKNTEKTDTIPDADADRKAESIPIESKEITSQIASVNVGSSQLSPKVVIAIVASVLGLIGGMYLAMVIKKKP